MLRTLGRGLMALMLLAGCVPEQQVQTGGQCVPKPAFQAPPVNPCADSERVRLTIVGDVLLHWPIQQTGYRYGFRKMWAQADPYLAWGDLTIGNMEGPVAPGVDQSGRQVGDPGPVYGTGVYTGFPMFNYHPQILKELKASGFDLMTTANNHAMDRGSLGADMTLREMSKAGLGAVGTIRSGAARRFAVRRGTALGTVSFIGCSFSTNGNPDPKRQVLLCYGNRSELLSLVRREAADPSVAAVIVLPHWGQEYSSTPDTQQVALARDLAAAGATAIVGTHPHAVQPFRLLNTGRGQVVPVVYSTGNFIAMQTEMPSIVGAIALLEMCKAPNGKVLTVNRLGWIAEQMHFTKTKYWMEIAPVGATGDKGLPYRHLSKIAPGFSAQPQACR
ncbi:CapA family protein [Profundibacter sp.]|uniref:CapA family protein n=1 Tax=Profundibacter sp. TaxID=3101071 RepID=UPI003D0B6386